VCASRWVARTFLLAFVKFDSLKFYQVPSLGLAYLSYCPLDVAKLLSLDESSRSRAFQRACVLAWLLQHLLDSVLQP
jgi:hypothetical protein